MRNAFWIALGLALAVATFAAVADRYESAEPLRARAPFARGHCGCMNKDNCTEPCTTCCGPNAYEDCFKHPSPSASASIGSRCCR